MTVKLLKAAVQDTESIEQSSKTSLLAFSFLGLLCLSILAYYTLVISS